VVLIQDLSKIDKMKLYRYFSILFIIVFVVVVEASNCTKVNLFIGTSGDNGQVDPGAAVPFGMVRVCPDSDPRSHSGYDYSVNKISGISVNRMSGVGCSGAGGNFSLKPSSPDFDLQIIKNSEKAYPGYYETQFNNGVRAELTATRNVAVERYFFPQNVEMKMVFNPGASFERVIDEKHSQTSGNAIEGYVVCANVCGHGQYKLYFNMTSDKSFFVLNDTYRKMQLSFDEKKSNKVEIRIAVSSVNLAAARKENELLEKSSFSRIKSTAASLWDQKLSKITVKGGSIDDQAIFYTSLYRVYLSPANVTSSGNQYLATDGKIMNAGNAPYYSSWSIWDTYRTKFPLLTLLEPTEMSNMAQSLVRLYQTGKVNWSTDSEATPTVRTEHAVILLLDAYRKGVTGIDFNACYSRLCKEANELLQNSPDQKLEATCDLWALAQIAEIIGNKTDADKYRTLSETLFTKTWKQEFMKPDSTFTKMGGNGLYQGTRWQYRWAAPQYLNHMTEWCSNGSLRTQLNYFFENHMFNQGNEPDIHVPFLFNRLGEPEKTQQIVRELLTKEIIHKYGGNAEFKTPYIGRAFKNSTEGFMPEMDEDDGTMGAWYIFCSMGVYPLVVGEPMYELTSPLFDKICITLENNNKLTIKTKHRKSVDDIVKMVYLNGKEINNWQLAHADLQSGSVIEFVY
jgi:putative alpha-1,2-mannosidase